MTCGAIICTRNRAVKLNTLLDSIVLQTRQFDEIIIIDSSEISIEQRIKAEFDIRERFDKLSNSLKIVYTDPGLTLQRNIGVNASSADILFFFDDDLILSNNFVELIEKRFIDNPEYYGGMGTISNHPKLNFNKIILGAFLNFFMLSTAYGNGKFKLSGLPSSPIGTFKFRNVEVLSGGLTAYRKEVFITERFDEYFEGYCYLEDVDFSRRVSRKFPVFYEPKAEVYHDHVSDDRGSSYALRKMYIQNYFYIFRKNYNKVGIVRLISFKLALTGLLLEEYIFGTNDGVKGIRDGIKSCRRKYGIK